MLGKRKRDPETSNKNAVPTHEKLPVFDWLPDETVLEIFRFLPCNLRVTTVPLVCKRFNKLAFSPGNYFGKRAGYFIAKFICNLQDKNRNSPLLEEVWAEKEYILFSCVRLFDSFVKTGVFKRIFSAVSTELNQPVDAVFVNTRIMKLLDLTNIQIPTHVGSTNMRKITFDEYARMTDGLTAFESILRKGRNLTK